MICTETLKAHVSPEIKLQAKAVADRECVGRDDLVIKVSISSNVANWTEFLIYGAHNEVDGAAIFGAIHEVSSSGNYLVMERLDDLFRRLAEASELPCLDD